MGGTESKFLKTETQNDEQEYKEVEAKTYLGEEFQKEKPMMKLAGQDNPEFTSSEFKWEEPLKLRSINHAALEAQDVDALAHFYCDVLGFKRLPRPDLGFPGHWLEGLGMMIHIIQRDPSVPLKYQSWKDQYTTEPEAWYIRRRNHLSFEVDDFDEAEHLLRQHGVEFSRFVLPDTNLRQLFLMDPEGNGIELGVYEDTRAFLKDHGVEPQF